MELILREFDVLLDTELASSMDVLRYRLYVNG